MVDMKLPGVSCGKPEKKMGIIGNPTSDIVLENVRVPASEMLGGINKGFTNALKTLDIGRIGIAAQSIGVSSLVFMVKCCNLFLNRCVFVCLLHLLQVIIKGCVGQLSD